MKSDGAVALGILGGTALASALSLYFFALETFDVPADEDYAAARALIEDDGYAPATDAVAILPPWSMRPLVELKVFRIVGSDDLASFGHDRFRRLYVLVEPDADTDYERVVEAFGQPTPVGEAGRVFVVRFDRQGTGPAFDFMEALPRARVSIVDDKGAFFCDVPHPRGHACRGKKRWQRVTRDWLLVTENAREAIWAHPPSKKKRLVIEYDDVTLGERLVFWGGFTREASYKAKAPVEVAIFVDDHRVANLMRAPTFYFEKSVVDTAGRAGPGHRVRFEIQTKNSGASHFAFDALALGAAP